MPDTSRFNRLATAFKRGQEYFTPEKPEPSEEEVRDQILADGLQDEHFRKALFDKFKEHIDFAEDSMAQGLESHAFMCQAQGAKGALHKFLEDLQGLTE